MTTSQRPPAPIRFVRRIVGVMFALELLRAAAPAQVLAPDDPRRHSEPSPEQDDATLHDVLLMGNVGVTVGDRGVVWRSADSGRTWEFRPTPVNVSLRGVSFVTPQLGWAVGIDVAPETRLISGVVIATSDGGRTWTRINQTPLPGLHDVHGFNAQSITAVGLSNPTCPSGVWQSSDGGRIWLPVPGARSTGWSAAAFAGARQGTLVGPRYQLAACGDGQVLPPQRIDSLQGLHDVRLLPDGRGWLVGDGALILHSTDGGVSWPEPPALPPGELRDGQNFHAVAAHGDAVWAAGAPGSIVWHSPDGGHSWQPQPTGDPARIEALHFSDAQQGCAVGMFGTIRCTSDGGRRWTTVHGGDRRTALLVMQPNVNDFAPLVTTRESGEQGYRSVAAVVTRRDIGPCTEADLHDTERLRAAQLSAGGNDIAPEWRLPVEVPGIDENYEALVAAWSRRHEQRLPQVMLGGLVAAIRTYRPEVILCDEPAAADAAARLLNEALPLAVTQAADPTRYPEHRTRLGLEPWSVSKTFRRTRDAQSPLAIDPYQILPHRGETLLQGARQAAARLLPAEQLTLSRECYRLLSVGPTLTAVTGTDPAASSLARGLFSGLNIPPGSDARRPLPQVTELRDDELAEQLRHQRNFDGFVRWNLDDPTRAGQLLAQVPQTVATLPPADAARWLADLVQVYRRRGHGELAEELCVQLVERFPHQPAAHAMMPWLLTRWTSQELLWHTVRGLGTQSPQRQMPSEILQTNYEQALAAAQAPERVQSFAPAEVELTAPPQSPTPRGSVRTGSLATFLDQSGRAAAGSSVPTGTNQMTVEIARRLQAAQRVSQLLEQQAPLRAAEPDVQFLRAALLRATGEQAQATELYRRWFGLEAGLSPWNSTARGELWTLARGPLSPKPVLHCRRTTAAPILDGQLADACWRTAESARLTPDEPQREDADPTFVGDRRLPTADGVSPVPASDEPGAAVMLSYDDRYLYMAACVPRHPNITAQPVRYAGRQHDADLGAQDRLVLALDVDRDYATWYRFEVDQRGSTREALCDDDRWNPHWYVAAEGDDDTWQVEAAIPWEALVPQPPQRGAIWAAGLTRVIPTVELQSWTQPAAERPRGETFGLVQFD